MVPYEGGFCVPLKGWESPRRHYHTGVIKIPSGDKSKSRLLGLFSRLEKKKKKWKQNNNQWHLLLIWSLDTSLWVVEHTKPSAGHLSSSL